MEMNEHRIVIADVNMFVFLLPSKNLDFPTSISRVQGFALAN